MKAKVKDAIYHNLPFKTKEELIQFANAPIKVCPICSKVDVSLKHVDECNEEYAFTEQLRIDNLWK